MLVLIPTGLETREFVMGTLKIIHVQGVGADGKETMRSYSQWLAKQDCVFPMFEPACQYVTMKAAHRVENSGEKWKKPYGKSRN